MHVTVVIPTYNGERFVAEALRSVLAQTHEDLDVVVVDDGSTDATAEAVWSVVDERVRMIEQENGGVAAARNRGLQEAGGEYVAFLDQDDVWFPDKLATQLPVFAAPDVGLVGSLMTYLGPRGPVRATAGVIADHQHERIAAARIMPFPQSSVIARTGLLRDLGGFDADLVRMVAPVDDLDLVSRVARTHRVLTVPRPLGYYRIHPGAGSFASFYGIQRGSRFVQARVVARLAGGDLEWGDWDLGTRDGVSVRRLERAGFLYRSAGLRIASGERVKGSATLAMAAALAPRYTTRRLRRQLS